MRCTHCLQHKPDVQERHLNGRTVPIIIAVALALLAGAGCESSTGNSTGGGETSQVIQLPERVVVTTLEDGVYTTESWSDITDFEPNGDTLFIEGKRIVTLDDEPTDATRTYDVCEIDSLVILPTYLVPELLDCEEVESALGFAKSVPRIEDAEPN